MHPDGLVTVVSVQWFGSEALELTYKTAAGTVANELLYRHDEPRLEVVAQGRPWSFDGDGALFRLVSEAQRIRLAHLFDPLLAIHTSVVDPLPHQITGVYDAMLPRQPLRFLLADDPGAGKTIMAGLLIKELVARGDLERCLIVCPGPILHRSDERPTRDRRQPDEGGARRGGGRRRRPHEEARRGHRRHPVRQHHRGAAPGGEGRTPRLRQFPSPAPRAAPWPQSQNRRAGGRAVEARRLLPRPARS